MSRIRSIHPGLFTDEDYMCLSFPARELVKGVWVEADDQGIFEWKLRTIKARIMPSDNVDMDALMAELIEYRFVRQFSHDGKIYGAIRNFGKFQRPKKPNALYPLPEEIKAYVAFGWKRGDSGSEPSSDEEGDLLHRCGDSSEQVPHQLPPDTENSGQMEDGGWKREKEIGGGDARSLEPSPESLVVSEFLRLRRECWPNESRFPAPTITIAAQARGYLDAGGTVPLICEVIKRGMHSAAADKKPAAGSLLAFEFSLKNAIANYCKALKTPTITEVTNDNRHRGRQPQQPSFDEQIRDNRQAVLDAIGGLDGLRPSA